MRKPLALVDMGVGLIFNQEERGQLQVVQWRGFSNERQDEMDITIAFYFYLNFISFNVARSPLFIEICRVLIERAPTSYVPPISKKLRTTLLVKAKKEVYKILEPIRSE